MNALLHPFLVITLAVLPWTVAPQDSVQIQFQVSPVQVASGTDAVFTVQTISSTFSVAWLAPGAITLGQWIGGQAVLNPVPQYQGRVTITANQLKITSSLLSDAGNYTVTVVPSATTGLSTNSRAVELKVFDAVSGVTLFVPSITIEGGNVSMRCTWTKGTGTSVAWGKGGAGLSSDSHLTISDGSLVINPASRSDAGQYTCTVSNPVSAQTATATLTVYYGPDTPQVSKTSSDCVGGGDVTVGQTIQLTCASASLPPASLSWQFNGQTLTGTQPSSGTLSLQVFNTSQSGPYTCTARNSVTLGTSQQQINLNVVSTCLSAGAVAGIAVACFVVLVLIIVAIVLILRQRNVDRRLRDVIGLQKTYQNNGPTNGQVTTGLPGGADQPEPPLHNPNRPPKNQHTDATVWHTGQDQNGTLRPNNNTSVLQHNGHLNTGTLLNNDNLNSTVLPHNGHQNNNSSPHNGNNLNSSSFPQSGQQNPNILIQTGNTEPGSHTVLINVNTLPQSQQRNGAVQPQTVQVSLTAPQPPSTQPTRAVPYNDQTRAERLRGTAQDYDGTLRNREQVPDGQAHRGYTHPTNQTQTSRHTANTHSRTPDATSGTSTDPRQMPWDRLHGTPAYPNPQVDSSDSSYFQDTGLRHAQSSQTRQQRVPVQTNSGDARRNQAAQPNPSAQPHNEQQNRTSTHNHESRNPPAQAHVAQNPEVSQRNPVPQTQTATHNQPTQTQTAQPSNPIRRTVPDQRQALPHAANPPNQLPLTQATLQHHTTHTPNPFSSRIQQTQAALQHHGTRSAPGQPSQPQNHPTTQANRAGQRAPTPPPVLRPAEFRTLPRENAQRSHTQPHAPNRQRPPNTHRHTRAVHTSPQRHAGNQHMHPTANRHADVHRHQAHTNQAHRNRPRH